MKKVIKNIKRWFYIQCHYESPVVMAVIIALAIVFGALAFVIGLYYIVYLI